MRYNYPVVEFVINYEIYLYNLIIPSIPLKITTHKIKTLHKKFDIKNLYIQIQFIQILYSICLP